MFDIAVKKSGVTNKKFQQRVCFSCIELFGISWHTGLNMERIPMLSR